MGRKKQLKYAKSRRFSVGFPAFRHAFLKHFKEELKYHEGPTRADLEGIYHEYVESKLTLGEFLKRRKDMNNGQK